MRTLFYLLSLAGVIAIATWTYQVNYATRAAERRVKILERQISDEAEKIEVLKAEWAYLNRPERLLRLAEANFEILGLSPVDADHFADAAQVAFPLEELKGAIVNPTSISGSIHQE